MLTDDEQSLATQSLVSRAILLYIRVLVGLFILALSIVSFRGYVLHQSYPFNNILFKPEVRFTDWTECTRRVVHFGEKNLLGRTDVGPGYAYPAPTIYLFLIFVRFFHNSLRAYLFTASFIFVASTAIFSVQMRRLARDRLPQVAIWLTLVMGFPALFLIDRGNIEVFLWLFVLLGMVAFTREAPYAAALLFALTASMKIYPILYLLLFLPRRQYKAAALGAVAVGVFSWLAVAGIDPNIMDTWHTMSRNAVLMAGEIAMLNSVALRFDHSIFGVLKQSILLYIHGPHLGLHGVPPTFEKSMRVYSVVAPLAFLAVYFARLRRLPIMNQFMGLTLCCLLLPYISYEYTLVYVYLMWGAFLCFIVTDVRAGLVALSSRRASLMMVLFAISVAPLSFLILTSGSGFAGQVKSCALLLLLGVILSTPMPSTLFGDLRPGNLESSSTDHRAPE